MALTGIFIAIFLIFGHFQQVPCLNREKNTRFFKGTVLTQRQRALHRDVLKKIRTLGPIQCGHACLSENNCVSQTYCQDQDTGKGVCFLHTSVIQEEQLNILVRNDKCTYQQYVNFHEATCTQKCNDRGRCQFDYANRRYSCNCEVPYDGEYCENTQAVSFFFKPLGAKGNTGPTSTSLYTKTALEGTVTLDKGIQIWTVPFTAPYVLTVAGASGGGSQFGSGGRGAIISGVIPLIKGTKLHILIGQKGTRGINSAGGGGGTFVSDSNNVLLAAAGGGGGGGRGYYDTRQVGDKGQVSENGSVNGGVNGLGGRVNGTEKNDAGGGGGYKGNGKCCSFVIGRNTCTSQTCSKAGLSYLSGGLGGTSNSAGGFGGGGAASPNFPGGGGGYSGGGVNASQAGGGGSYYTSGMKPSTDQNDGDGYMFIEVKTV
ncbi:ALK tyrosine kinase receptor-like [Montipora foliosa]|uniref:ALK tyrosine kinase receptor-like n=1 Tax=Montipora foliosa TaxID=591990 RepID=UPI0035F1592D